MCELNRSPSHRPRTVNSLAMPSITNMPNQIARFDEDFKALDLIGGTTIAKVFRCQNKLDGLIYTVKIFKQPIDSKSRFYLDDELLTEVNQALSNASLNILFESPYIVRFYNAWIEDDRLHLVVVKRVN